MLIKDTLGSDSIFGRFHVVWQWLAVLNKIHNGYKSNNRNFPTKDEFELRKEIFNRQIKQVVSNAKKSTSAEAILYEETLGSDVSEIRQTNLATTA